VTVRLSSTVPGNELTVRSGYEAGYTPELSWLRCKEYVPDPGRPA